MKKKKGVIVRTILTVVGLILTVGAFLFTGVSELVSLYSKNVAYIAPLSWKTIFQPIVSGFTSLGEGFSGRFFSLKIAILVVLGLLLIALLLLVTSSIVKRRAKYIGQILLVVLSSAVGLYVISYIGQTYEIFGGVSIARQIITLEGKFVDILLFKVNTIAGILLYVFIVGCLLTLVSAIALTIITFSRIIKTERRPQVVEVKEETPAEVAQAPVKFEETKQEPVEKKTKKVVLVVKRFDAFKDIPQPVIERPTEYPRQQVEVKPLTKEDIRTALKDELDAREREARKYSPITEEPKTVIKPVVSVSEADATAPVSEEPLTPTPIIITIPEPIKELAKEEVKVEPKKPALTKEDIKTIIQEELAKALESLKQETVEEVVEEVKEVPVEVIKEVPVEVIKEVEVPVEEPQVIDETVTVKEEKVEPVVEEQAVITENNEVVVQEEPVVTKTPATTETETQKVERISFSTRMQNADDSLKDSYNHLKSLLLSYGLRSRVSNGGDAFRLHKVNYCKIVVAGNSLKLYLALDPKDYKNSTLPVKDASSKAIYKDIPLVFKVKSGLSLRRAEQLITEMMDKHGLEQVDRVEVKDYVSELANIQETDDVEE